MRQKLTQEQLQQSLAKLAIVLVAMLILGSLFFIILLGTAGAMLIRLVP